jgi:hypothetical protein
MTDLELCTVCLACTPACTSFIPWVSSGGISWQAGGVVCGPLNERQNPLQGKGFGTVWR